MKYKVGDKVKIKSLDWYNANKNKYWNVSVYYTFVKQMSPFCGKTAIIREKRDRVYKIDLDKGEWNWTDEMFEENFNKEDMKTKKIVLPEGWEIDKVENGEIILKESKKELPKTWEECFKLLDSGEFIDNCSNIIRNNPANCPANFNNYNIVPVGLGKPLLALCQLLVCREVYRGGWVPDWSDEKQAKHSIYIVKNKIVKDKRTTLQMVLSFQSAEIRDQFLENFRDLIEEAKELI